MKNFEEYHDLYLETDVLLLADVFMNYTIMCLQDDGLDPSHYVSALGMFNNSLYNSHRTCRMSIIANDIDIDVDHLIDKILYDFLPFFLLRDM